MTERLLLIKQMSDEELFRAMGLIAMSKLTLELCLHMNGLPPGNYTVQQLVDRGYSLGEILRRSAVEEYWDRRKKRQLLMISL